MIRQDIVDSHNPFRILIDTNVIISAEKDDVIRSDVAELTSFAVQNRVVVMIHPASIDDITRDKDLRRKSIFESKIKKYPILDDNDQVSPEFAKAVGKSTRVQDTVDDRLLYSVLKNAVHFLVTEDWGIHKKARKTGLSDRTLLISDALVILRRLYGRYVPENFALDHFEIHNLKSDYAFFDSIRDEYPTFGSWFAKKSLEGRMCWCWRDGSGELKALLIYAEKTKKLSRDTPERCLKICTLKVDDNARGMKLGELLLKMCFEYCHMNGIETAYIDTHEWHTELRLLLEDFGFTKTGNKSQNELRYVKDFTPAQSLDGHSPFEFCKRFFPAFYDGEEVRKFVVPIRPEFHDRLLGCSRNKQRMIEEFHGFVVQQNTIKKAYICKAPTRRVQEGDVLLFYRSRKDAGITGVGVVEAVTIGPHTLEEMASLVGVRSVYTRNELAEYGGIDCLVILFRHIGQFRESIRSTDILEQRIMKRPPQTITQLGEDGYSRVRDRVRIWSIC